MRLYAFLLALFVITVLGVSAYADTPKMSLVTAQPIEINKTSKIIINLNNVDGSPLTVDQLKEVHTQKFHLLVIDHLMTDYHHLHPIPTAKAGEYEVNFTPKTSNDYIFWADITTPAGHYYLKQDLAGLRPMMKMVDKTTVLQSTAGELTGVLVLDPVQPKAGGMLMATFKVTDKAGKSLTDLQPVMGAFAHVVGFSVEKAGVIHIHPMGPEPKSADERGKANLMLHFEGLERGTYKVFAQIKRENSDVFIPFTFSVE